MSNQRALLGERPPSYLSKATLAAELDVSESTVDSYVQRDLLPKPVRLGGSVRWCWADVAAKLAMHADGENDPFMKGVGNV